MIAEGDGFSGGTPRDCRLKPAPPGHWRRETRARVPWRFVLWPRDRRVTFARPDGCRCAPSG
jgi:hypothetical protein